MLNTVVAEHSAQATKTADSLFPSALLAAGEEDLARDGYEGGVRLRSTRDCVSEQREAAQAQSMLAAPQTVTGTLVDPNGVPAPDRSV